ncbi:MAG: type II toxin-antitoxin system RelE family toxin, partial [Pseudanabaenaceae cyanobacterium]
MDGKQKTITIVDVGHRNDVYDGFKRGFMTVDLRSLGTPVYEALNSLKTSTNNNEKLKKQKSMAQELYTYLSTWGLMRLKAEEIILKDGREEPVKKFFECLAVISGNNNLSLDGLKKLSADEYLGLTGLGLEIAREFSFWVSAIYHDVKGED